MIAAGVALGALAYAPSPTRHGALAATAAAAAISAAAVSMAASAAVVSAAAMAAMVAGAAWGYPYFGVGWGYPYDYDAADCTLRRVHVHTVHGWRWRTYEYC